MNKQSGMFSRLGPAGPLALFAAVGPPLGTIALFATAGVTVPWLREQGSLGVWVYAAAFAVCTGLALLPTYAQSGLAGYAFGVVNGSIASIVGFIGGSLIGYAIASRVSGERIVKLSEENPKFAAIRRALVGVDESPGANAARGTSGAVPRHFWRTLGLVTLLRVPPNSPFAVMNLALASLRVPRVPFVLGTAIGMAPRTILAAALGSWIAGSQAGAAAAGGAEFTSDAWYAAAPRWLYFVGLGVTAAVLIALTMLANRVIARAAGAPRADNSTPG